jgi:hypothetical protein
MDFKISEKTKTILRDIIYEVSDLYVIDPKEDKYTSISHTEFLFRKIKKIAKAFPNDSELGQIVRNHVNEDLFTETL